MFENYIQYLPTRKDIKVIDIGCGGGDLIIFLQNLGFKDVCGVDIDEDAISACRGKGLTEVEKIDNLCDFLKTKTKRYALIFAREVIYYFPRTEIAQYLKAVRESLADDGIFVIEVFNGSTLTGHFIKDKDHGINMVFTEHSLRKSLEDSGFQVTALIGNKTVSRGLKRKLWVAMQSIWFTLLKSIYILERGLDPDNPKILSKTMIAVAKRK